MKRSLTHFPISLFAIVLGLSGFSIALQKLPHFGLATGTVGVWMLGVSAAVYVLVAVGYLLKLALRPGAVRAEFLHPIRLSFFPTISIGLLLLSIAAHGVWPVLAQYLWYFGTVLQAVFTLLVVSVWMRHTHFEITHMNPAWFIPAVGNVIVPVVGVQYAPVFISWVFFGIGMLFWVVLLAIFFNRAIFHHPLPAKLLPTLSILIAPPAVGFIALAKLSGGVLPASYMLYGVATFFVLLLVLQLDLLAKITFYLSWWAYSFPLAAYTIATVVLYEQTPWEPIRYWGIGIAVVLTMVIIMLTIQTIHAMVRGEVCVEEQ